MLNTTEYVIGPAAGVASPSPRGFVLAATDHTGTRRAVASVLESDGLFHLTELDRADAPCDGAATALLAAVEKEVVTRGATLLTLQAENGDVAFYERSGYTRPAALPVALRWLTDDTRVALERTLAPHVVPRAAVSVVPLRDGPDGIEVFVQYRASTMDFGAGAVVFPGGRLDPADHDTGLTVPATHSAAWSATALPPADALAAAAIREVEEECGVTLDATDLHPWDNWVTPAGGRRRFDVAFYLTAVPTERAGAWRNTTTEAHESRWVPVSTLLREHDRGDIRLMAPTLVLLLELAAWSTSAEVLSQHPHITPVKDDDPVRPRF